MQEEDEDGATNDGLCGSKTAKTTGKTGYTTSCKLLMSNLFKLSFLMADNTEVLDSFLARTPILTKMLSIFIYTF